jgi:hypothetical protein
LITSRLITDKIQGVCCVEKIYGSRLHGFADNLDWILFAEQTGNAGKGSAGRISDLE